ncbi:transposase [Escherichia coli]|nr:transposase [Escherichia coli]
MNIIRRLKSGMLPTLFFLTSACVLAHPLIIPPGHWQDGMAVGGTEFSCTLYVPEVSWQWQPRSVRMSTPDAVLAGLTTGKSGMVSESRRGQDFYILGGHITSQTTARPGLQSSVTLLQVTPSSPRIAARGELARGQVRYGDITFTMRHLLAWQDSSSMETTFVLDALEQALWARRPSGTIHHSDKGSHQYVSLAYTQRLKEAGLLASTGSTGDSYDNAMAESINGLYKAEVIHRKRWKNRTEEELATLMWVDWYNNRRLLERLGHIPPAEAEKAYYASIGNNDLAA